MGSHAWSKSNTGVWGAIANTSNFKKPRIKVIRPLIYPGALIQWEVKIKLQVSYKTRLEQNSWIL